MFLPPLSASSLATSFLLDETHFPKTLDIENSKWEDTKSVSFSKIHSVFPFPSGLKGFLIAQLTCKALIGDLYEKAKQILKSIQKKYTKTPL